MSSGDWAAQTPAAAAPASAPRAVCARSIAIGDGTVTPSRTRVYPERGLVVLPHPRPDEGRQPGDLPPRALDADPVLPSVLPPRAHRARAHPDRGTAAAGGQPPLVPRPVRARHDAQAARLLRRQARAVR